MTPGGPPVSRKKKEAAVSQSPEWERIEAILDGALDLEPEARAEFLDRACSSDSLLRSEVEALLEADAKADGFLERPVADYAATFFGGLGQTDSDQDRQIDWSGRSVGPYQLRSAVGRGGMGEVYEAWDDRLERKVALKRIFSSRFDDEPGQEGQRQRFLREARAAAGLDHPSIVRIHDVLEAEGEDWLVMEYLEGETLAEQIAERPLAEDTALSLVRQIAAGLAEAHGRGIIHRDLKPENVFITQDGRAKIFDFGLAQQVSIRTPKDGERERPSEESSEDAGSAGSEGRLIGTVRAMSPEQVRGQPLDARSDLFSLGSLLYQAVTTLSPFEAETTRATLERISDHPHQPARRRRTDLSAATSALIDRLLEKDPERRPQAARDVVRSIDRRQQRLRFRRIAAWLVGILVVLTIVAISFRPEPAPRSLLYVAVSEPDLAVDSETEASADIELVANGVFAAAQQALSEVVGLAVLPAAGSAENPDTVIEAARALGAEEALTSELRCPAERCQLTLSRRLVESGQVLWLKTLEIPVNDLHLVRTAVTSGLREGYSEFSIRPSRAELVPHEAFVEYLRLIDRHREGQPGTALAVDIAALRSEYPKFLEIQLLEAKVAREVFYSNREPDWLARALDRLAVASSLAPRDPRVPAALFDVAEESERWDLAEQALGELQQLEPGGTAALQREAELLSHRGERERALESMREAARRRPANQLLFNLSLMEYQQGEVEAARATLERLLERSPAHYRAQLFLAQLELIAGSPERALPLFEALAGETADALAHTNLGTAYLLVGRYEEAAERFLRAHELQPRNAIVVLNLADALELQGVAEQARQRYNEVLERLDDDPSLLEWQALTVRAQALAHLGRRLEAVDAVESALAAEPDNPQVASEAALVYALLGDAEATWLHTERALDSGLASHWFELPWFEILQGVPEFLARTKSGTDPTIHAD